MTSVDDRTIDLLDGYLYAGDPDATYAWLRDARPGLPGRDQRHLGHLALPGRARLRAPHGPVLERARLASQHRRLDVDDQHGRPGPPAAAPARRPPVHAPRREADRGPRACRGHDPDRLRGRSRLLRRGARSRRPPPRHRDRGEARLPARAVAAGHLLVRDHDAERRRAEVHGDVRDEGGRGFRSHHPGADRRAPSRSPRRPHLALVPQAGRGPADDRRRDRLGGAAAPRRRCRDDADGHREHRARAHRAPRPAQAPASTIPRCSPTPRSRSSSVG